MKVKLTAFGIAKDIIQSRSTILEVPSQATLSLMRALLYEKYPAFKELATLSFAVQETYQTDDFILQEMDEVVLIPPVSGG